MIAVSLQVSSHDSCFLQVISFYSPQTGLPAAVIDLMSTPNTITTQNAKTVEEIFREKEKLVNRFCQEILAHKDHQYSNLVLPCGNSSELSTRCLRPLHVCKARRRHHYAVALQTHRFRRHLALSSPLFPQSSTS